MSERRVLATVWSGMGLWRWVGLLLVLIALTLTPLGGPSRPAWIAATPLAGSAELPVTLESRCHGASGRCHWRLQVEDGGVYRWRETGTDGWNVAEGAVEEVYAARPAAGREEQTRRVEVCAAEPVGRCARWELPR